MTACLTGTDGCIEVVGHFGCVIPAGNEMGVRFSHTCRDLMERTRICDLKRMSDPCVEQHRLPEDAAASLLLS